jgi:hypothetical protein
MAPNYISTTPPLRPKYSHFIPNVSHNVSFVPAHFKIKNVNTNNTKRHFMGYSGLAAP